MSDIQTGGPAFPYGTAYPGMTMRDYFAAKAMQAILSDPKAESVEPCFTSEWAYKHADAMIKAREAK